MSRATFTLPDSRSKTDYHLYVGGSVESGEPRAAVLFMDGDDQFAAAVSGYDAARAHERVPPLLLVGVELLEQQFAVAPFPQLDVVSHRFPGRDHYNVLEDAFRVGCEALFNDV